MRPYLLKLTTWDYNPKHIKTRIGVDAGLPIKDDMGKTTYNSLNIKF